MVSCGQDKEVRVWELASGRCEHVLIGHTDDVRGVSAASDGRLAASCSFDKTVRVWDLVTGQEVSVMEGHTDKVFGGGDGGGRQHSGIVLMGHVGASLGRGDGAGGGQADAAAITAWEYRVSGFNGVGGVGGVGGVCDVGGDEAVGYDWAREGGA